MEHKWSVTDLEKKMWVRIENADNWKIKELPRLHPSSPKYINLWQQYSRWCIEGFWNNDFGYWRFMPPKLFFYINFWIMVRDDGEKVSTKAKPMLRDVDWEIAYMFLVAKGFSGFEEDDDTNCHLDLQRAWKGEIPKDKLHTSCIKLNGELKRWEDPLEYCRRLHDRSMGKALYLNAPKNAMLFGARSSGKTYTVSAFALHDILFCGETNYDEYLMKKRNQNQEEAGICIGASNTGKSSQFFKYMEEQMRQFAINSELGVWGKVGDEDYEPCPFFRNMAGETKPNNAKSPWREQVLVKGSNGIDVNIGSGSFAKHVNYKDDAEAAASGRYNYNIIEEIGLLEDAPVAWSSNEFTVKRGARKTGTLVGLGTSGDIEKVEGAKQIFLHPSDYDLVSYADVLENTGQMGRTGLFLPAYMIDMSFKDKDGNTDIEAAKKTAWDKLDKLKDNPVGYRAACMHSPLLISHMWITSGGNFLPREEARAREKELLKKNAWRDLGKPVKLVWDQAAPRGVRADFDFNLTPIISPFVDGADKLDKREGCVVIYKEPEFFDIKKKDLYYIVHDPYVSSTGGESLGATYVFANPKYLPEGHPGNTLMASYIGKPETLDKYNENLEKLVQYYGNPMGGLWYEANRGENVRHWFIKKNKQYVLSIRPTSIKGSRIYEAKTSEHGYLVGNKMAKINLVQYLNDWLLEETELPDGKKRNIERLPCLYTVRQIAMFDINDDENYDGVSALMGLPLALKEQEVIVQKEINNKNPLTFLSNNGRIFKQHGHPSGYSVKPQGFGKGKIR